MRPAVRFFAFLLLFAIPVSTLATKRTPSHKPILKKTNERSFSIMGFRGKIAITPIYGDKIEISIRTSRGITLDTIRGHSVFPILVSGKRQPFFMGKFGAATFPMLIFAVTDPDRVQDSHVLSYQISPAGSIFGQQVLVDQSLDHAHSDEVIGGRYQLAALNPTLGAIYTVSYQDARFDGFYVSYEKLRIRQYDPTISAFIEADQGFLRESNGKLVEASRFHTYDDKKREALFVANVRPSGDMQATRPIARSVSVPERQAMKH